jgi:hypothetical protein
MKLEQGAVSGVGIGHEDGVRQVGTQPVGVSDRNHLVIDSIDCECGMTDPLQVCKAITDNVLPLSKCRYLSLRHLRSRDGLAVLGAHGKSLDECGSRGLAGIGGFKEQLL